MAKTPFGTTTQQSATQQIDQTLDYDYEQLRKDAIALTHKTTKLLVRLHKLKGGEDPRVDALVHAEKCLVDADFHLREGKHLAHLNDV